MKKTTLKHLVTEELQRNVLARSDDRELVYAILARYGFTYPKEAFFALPNIGYITRAKRLVQREYEPLRGPVKRSVKIKEMGPSWTERFASLFR